LIFNDFAAGVFQHVDGFAPGLCLDIDSGVGTGGVGDERNVVVHGVRSEVLDAVSMPCCAFLQQSEVVRHPDRAVHSPGIPTWLG